MPGVLLATAADFITRIKDAVDNLPGVALTEVRDELYNVLGPSGLDWIVDTRDVNGNPNPDQQVTISRMPAGWLATMSRASRGVVDC